MAQSFCLYVKVLIFAPLLRKARAFSSAGSEHLPYKQRVGGSNPSTPTKKEVRSREPLFSWAWRPPFFSSLTRTVALWAISLGVSLAPIRLYLCSFFEALRTNKMTNFFSDGGDFVEQEYGVGFYCGSVCCIEYLFQIGI